MLYSNKIYFWTKFYLFEILIFYYKDVNYLSTILIYLIAEKPNYKLESENHTKKCLILLY